MSRPVEYHAIDADKLGERLLGGAPSSTTSEPDDAILALHQSIFTAVFTEMRRRKAIAAANP